MSSTAAIRLIKSLSKSEKRHFKMNTRKQSGNKDYLDLFDIIDHNEKSDSEHIRKEFSKHHSASSMNNTARYLVKVLTDSLIQSKTEKDIQFQLLQQLMRVKVLQERSLQEEGYKELKKIRKSATVSQQHFIQYFTYRFELDYFANRNFQDLPYKDLIDLQLSAKDALKTLNHIQDHHSLFELMKYRLVHSGKVLSDEDKKRLNDLMLSEMIVMTGKAKNSFESQKLHLLFQSFFFTNIGDYRSALKTFHELNKLFEKNLEQLDHPPLDYLTTLNGILDSLNTLENYEEMTFYINKVQGLDLVIYPEYFRYMARKIIATCRLAIFTGRGMFREGVEYIESLPAGLLEAYNMIDEEKQWELYFYHSLCYFSINDLKKAHRYIHEIMHNNLPHTQLSVYKAIRLLNIIIYYELNDTQYLEYEIRAYKRLFQQKTKLLKTEKFIFKIIQLGPKGKIKNIVPDKKTLQLITSISKDRYEKQMLRYFDFVGCMTKKMKWEGIQQ